MSPSLLSNQFLNCIVSKRVLLDIHGLFKVYGIVITVNQIEPGIYSHHLSWFAGRTRWSIISKVFTLAVEFSSSIRRAALAPVSPVQKVISHHLSFEQIVYFYQESLRKPKGKKCSLVSGRAKTTVSTVSSVQIFVSLFSAMSRV